MSQQEQQDKSQYFYRASAADFMKIPGSPVAYWASSTIRNIFSTHPQLGEEAPTRKGMVTGDNNKFTRYWFEVSYKKVGWGCESRASAISSAKKWFPYIKGGGFRKWYGNVLDVVDWENDGFLLRNAKHPKADRPLASNFNLEFIFKPNITWGTVTSSEFSARYSNGGSLFDQAGNACFPSESSTLHILGFLNSKVSSVCLKTINPTLNFVPGDIFTLPVINVRDGAHCSKVISEIVELSKRDWDSFETSSDFSENLFLTYKVENGFMSNIFGLMRNKFYDMTCKLRELEIENNSAFIDLYGLSSELDGAVLFEEVTLLNNPHHRYGKDLSDVELRGCQQSDITTELLSYLIGCMMGRYSIDKPGLILASQGETLQDYLNQIPSPRFMPDNDAILPLTDQEWFADDVTNRVREFVKVVWGEETLQENLAFIAESLCLHAIKGKKGESAIETIRRYLSTQFYKDHVKTYKKRPIYWLFSSGKEKAFECLVYLHRYNESTLARMRTEYVTPLMGKYDAQQSLLQEQLNDANPAQQRELEKQLKDLAKKQTELRAFDENLKHYADMRIKLDLDDGVKVNYGKFGNLLADVKAITGDKE